MAINYPGPYEVDYTYNVTIGGLTLPHHLRVNCMALGNPAVGTPMSSINFQTIGGTPAAANTCISTLWGWIRQQLNNTVTCTGAVLYKYAPGTFAKTFISAYASALPNGASALGSGDAHQFTQSYITANGGILKLTILEDINSTLKNVAPVVVNAAGTNDQKLAAYMLSSAGWVIGRDDAFPTAGKNQTFGENEATFKARHR